MWLGVHKRVRDACHLFCPPTTVFSVNVNSNTDGGTVVTCDAVVLIPSRRHQDQDHGCPPFWRLLPRCWLMRLHCPLAASSSVPLADKTLFLPQLPVDINWWCTRTRAKFAFLLTYSSLPSAFQFPQGSLQETVLLMLLFLKRRSEAVSPIKALIETWWGASPVAAV